eukprot:3700177-Prymnesium_polylepis.1
MCPARCTALQSTSRAHKAIAELPSHLQSITRIDRVHLARVHPTLSSPSPLCAHRRPSRIANELEVEVERAAVALERGGSRTTPLRRTPSVPDTWAMHGENPCASGS